jgi:hypothetical protein
MSYPNVRGTRLGQHLTNQPILPRWFISKSSWHPRGRQKETITVTFEFLTTLVTFVLAAVHLADILFRAAARLRRVLKSRRLK